MYPAKNERVNESDICHFFSLMWPLLIYEYELVIFTQILGIAEFQKKVLLCISSKYLSKIEIYTHDLETKCH